MAITWITPAGSLGTIPELQTYSLNLETYSPGTTVSYTLTTGSLPSGLELETNGYISGNTLNVLGSITSNFTVRATDTTGVVNDRGFSLTVASTIQPNITPSSGELPLTITGNRYRQTFTLVDTSNLADTEFTLANGTLPSNLELAANGNLRGVVTPITSNTTYSFTVLADDGAKIDAKDYTLNVINRKSLGADSTYYSADNVSIITADTGLRYTPFFTTPAGSLGNVTQGSEYYEKIDATDFDNDSLTYFITSGSLPAGLTIQANTGYITGSIPVGNVLTVTSTFGVQARKTLYPDYLSNTVVYSITVTGQTTDTISWVTASNLGTIYNGEISEFYVEAEQTNGSQLNYSLVGNGLGGLPVGLTLLPDGVIAGRVSFDIPSSPTTYTFTIRASNSNGTAILDKEFTIQVAERNSRPYENLYIQLLPDRAGRDIYNTLISNTDVFPNSYIYRYWDPWFGRNLLRRVLFLTGLNPDTDAEYINAITLNHYWKRLGFGSLRTAIAKDDNFNTIYEVVYVELIDDRLNPSGFGPNLAESVPTNSQNVSTIYPNSFPNMIQRLTDNIGYQDRGILPRWMTSRQDDGTVLGFTRALVLAYVNPGRSAEVAYRVSQVIEDFNLIDFTIDRYEWDNILSNNFIKTDELVSGTGNITANLVSPVVVGSGTLFETELAPNAQIYWSNILLGNVANISSNTTLTLAANSAVVVANSAFTFGNIFNSNSYIVATGNITANTSSNIVVGLQPNVTGAGTISGTSGGTSITGNSTSFTTEAKVGKNIYVAGNSIGTIRSITSSTSLSLLFPLTANLSAVNYEIEGVSTAFTSQLHIGDTLLVNNSVLGTVNSISSDTELTLLANATANITGNGLGYSYTYTDPYTTPSTGDKYLKYPQFGVLS
jgi:hypothetical protein